jgi:PilZ domain
MINTLERRRFIRITDNVKLRYWRSDKPTQLENCSDQNHLQFMGIESQVQILLRHLPTQAHKFSELLQLINQKLNLLELRINPPNPAFQQIDVNLSGCGIAFAIAKDEQYDVGTLMQIEMILPPYDSPIGINAEVIKCGVELEMPEQVTLRLEFRGMPTQMEDLLIHYILKRQSQLMKINRSQKQA